MTEVATLPSDRAGHSRIADVVCDYAKQLSERAFDPPVEQVPPAIATMAYDDYRDLRFRPDCAVWRDENLGSQLQFFVAAYIYKSPVDIFFVENDTIRKFEANSSLFDFGRQVVPTGVGSYWRSGAA
ncbi:MAG: glucan biosynthesis protein [Proteobacteria bacterium]|nr:glucan biosynthesis protein [Pseudomonadota bacterium]